ncbi:phenazine biosynthesis protein PhzF [Williamsia sp. 1138]|uniref:PhzF family phenazine biosynthesis protein n=1 Tax=Williamsia sp. 1138 TaxID=1903117 RepID=UPI000A1082CD|nr:PhzF family phenazine biosynthesis protein [Williamsia sp. 1138]OZG30982.1 phenazine biosynthesis protein PhzF [Williamsia sp. 1138]
MASRSFQQVDVFVSGSLTGNPVAVVFDADDLTDEQMAAFARWTNLSETTFFTTPRDPSADYGLRIFTPGEELPFAGHPTLGSAHAWLRAGGEPKAGTIIQECGVGLISIRRDGDALAFAAPPLVRSGPVDAADLDVIHRALGLRPSDVVASNWVDNGPRWIGLLLTSAQRVLEVRPDFAALGTLHVGLIGPYRDSGPQDRPDYEVRAFVPEIGVPEDPVTGSLNAGFATWLRAEKIAPERYVASQGTALGRAGRVFIDDDGTNIWVGGRSSTVIAGEVDLRHG